MEISQENIYGGVCFINATSLQCPDCKSTIKSLHQRFFFKYETKTNCLKKNILRENSMGHQLFNKAAAL